MRGSHGVLWLKTSWNGTGTIIEDCYFESPYKITRPFLGKNGRILMIVMYAFAGILENDTAVVKLSVGKGSRVTVTDQSYTKIFKMQQGEAVKKIRIFVDEGASLSFLPKPVIPFSGSRFRGGTEIEVQRGGNLVYREILSCGRLGSGEKFAFDSYRARLRIRYGGHLILNENTVLEPKKQDVECLGCYEGFTHQATLCFVGNKVPEEVKAAALLDQLPDIEFGVSSLMYGGLMIRILGSRAEQLMKACDAVIASL